MKLTRSQRIGIAIGLNVMAVVVLIVAALLVLAKPSAPATGSSSAGNTSAFATGQPTTGAGTPRPTQTPTLPPSATSVYYAFANGGVGASNLGNGAMTFQQPTILPGYNVGQDNFATEFTAHGNLVYMVAPSLAPNPDILALDAHTGAVQWSFTRDGPCTVQTSVSLGDYTDLADNNYYIMTGGGKLNPSACQFTSHKLVVLDPATGQQRWSAPATTLIGTAPGLALVYNGISLTALNSATGAKVWQQPLNDTWSLQNCRVDSSAIYLVGTDSYGQVVLAVSPQTGKIMWAWQPTIFSELYLETTLNGSLYVLMVGGSNNIKFVKLTNGKANWTLPGSASGGAVDSNLFSMSGRLFRRSVQPLHYSEVDPATGANLWQSSTLPAGFDMHDPAASLPLFYIGPYYGFTNGTQQQNTITAISPGSTAPAWTATVGGTIYDFGVSQGYVFVSTFGQIVDTGTPEPSYGGTPTTLHVPGAPFRLYLLDATTGKTIWHQTIAGPAFAFTLPNATNA